MLATVTNKEIIISDPTQEITKKLKKQLTCKDKSKEYQLRRMGKSKYKRSLPFYKKLQKEVYKSLLTELPNGDLSMPSGFYYIIESLQIPINDQRTDNGQDICLPWKNKPYDLRDYQQDALDLMLKNYRGLINFATGLGKTLLAVHAVRAFDKKTLIIVPTESIAKQFHEDLKSAFGDVKVGMYGSGKKKIKDVTVGIAASVNNNIELFKEQDLGLIIADEAHHLPADTFYDITLKLGDTGRIFGLTATDYRSDGKDIMIAGGCGNTIIRRDIKWGIDNGWLAKPYFIIRNVDTTDKPQFDNDKLKNYKEHVLNCDAMKNQILSDIQKLMKAGKRVMCLVHEVAHGKELSKQLGVPFATGQDAKSYIYIKQMNEGKIPAIIGTSQKVGEGVNITNIDVLILANFIASKGPVIQAIGRGLRQTETKDKCLILDYCPTGSDMLVRHAEQRIKYYREITHNVKII